MDCSGSREAEIYSLGEKWVIVVGVEKRIQNKVQFLILFPQTGFSESKVKQGIVFSSHPGRREEESSMEHGGR